MDIIEVWAILFLLFAVPTAISMILFGNRADTDERVNHRDGEI